MAKALLVLENGLAFEGENFGAEGEIFGELVFNTSMSGYQEILTDPSYKGQIVMMTSPHIGNYGVNLEDAESSRPFAEGFVVRESSKRVSNWRAGKGLSEYLKGHNIPGIEGVDTRRLTEILRNEGAMRAVISTEDLTPENLLKKVRNAPSMEGQDLAGKVTSHKAYEWDEILHPLEQDTLRKSGKRFRVIAYDFGVKQNILRSLAWCGCKIRVVPATTPAEEVLAEKPDGVILSNGPGDPAAVTYGIEAAKQIIGKLPVFGICLGHQILGLALGGKTYKLKFGHHGANHPVMDVRTRKVAITAQNHGFAVDVDSIPDKQVELTHINLNDKTVEGMRHKKLPVISVQYHPESSPGPHDARYLFEEFVEMMMKERIPSPL